MAHRSHRHRRPQPEGTGPPGDSPRLVPAEQAPPHTRPRDHTPALAERICRRLAAGERLKTICTDPTLPTLATVSAWVLDDVGDFARVYERARRVQAFAWADEILEIADEAGSDWKETARGQSADTEHIQRSKLRVDARKWLLAKALPKEYGDSLSLGADSASPVKVMIVHYDDLPNTE